MKKTLAIIALSMPMTCFSAFVTGNRLQEMANSNLRIDAGTATDKDYNSVYQLGGYVTGISDSFDGEKFCLSDGVSTGQVMDIVGKFSIEHPEIRHLNAKSIVVAALKRAFPCENN